MHTASDLVVGNEWGIAVSEDMMPKADRDRLGYQERRLLESKGDDRVTELASVIFAPVLFYDGDYFNEVGVTPDDLGTYFEDAIPVLQELTQTDTDGTILKAGFSMWSWLFPNYAIQAGATYFDKEAKRLVWADDEAFLYVCQFFRDLVQTHKVASPDLIFGKTSALSDGLAATRFCDSWLQRFHNGATPDFNVRTRPNFLMKNQTGGDAMKGVQSMAYSVGIGVAANIEDETRFRAAIEFWKFVYYNTAMQNDFGWENTSLVLLKGAPDYAQLVEGFKDTGPTSPGERTAECLYTGYTDMLLDLDRWVDLGKLRALYPIFTAMLEEIISTDRNLKEIVQEFEAQAQADWEENVHWVPGVVK
jgi:hypothetical protein